MTAAPHRERPVLPQRQSAADRRESDACAAQAHLDALLDDALAATFPASDPIALPTAIGLSADPDADGATVNSMAAG